MSVRKVIDLTARKIDAELKKDLAMLASDIQLAKFQKQKWQKIEREISAALAQTMEDSAIGSFQLENATLTLLENGELDIDWEVVR